MSDTHIKPYENNDINAYDTKIYDAKITAKNQVSIPKKIRETLDLNAGDEVIFEVIDGKVYMKKA